MASTPDQDVVSWLLKGAAALILFLLSLGIKDVRDRLRDAERLCSRMELLESKIFRLEQDCHELRKKVD